MSRKRKSRSNGSSPRARGTRLVRPQQQYACRFIPASAGNTRNDARPQGFRPVHPRERGEHLPARSRSHPSRGSSPRARGTPIFDQSVTASLRFIPASAGNTGREHLNSLDDSVHPRERGEHPSQASCRPPARGSSPRARGTPDGDPAECDCSRFIPASAGNTRRNNSMRWGASVHPRERGEHVGGGAPGVYALRFIPASAGNTLKKSTCF